MRYSYTPTKEFIDRRNDQVREDDRDDVNPYFQWDSEAPEWHQSDIDPKQTRYEGYEYDTDHEDLGHCDYKMYSKAGVKLSPYIQKQINEGNIDTLIIWKWCDRYKQLEEGIPVDYEIVGHVNAKDALAQINLENRFPFPLKYDII